MHRSPSGSRGPLSAALVLAAALAAPFVLGGPPARAADAPAAPAVAPGLRIGEPLPAFEAVDLDGVPLRSEDLRTALSPDAALALVNDAAKTLGATAALAADTGLASVPALAADGAVDKAKVVALAGAAGRRLGLVADETVVGPWTKVADVVAWLQAAETAPVVLLCWSPKCPTSKAYEERIFAAVAKHRARLYALGCNATDAPEDMKGYVATKELPLRVLVDTAQKVTDALGGKRTPHAFVFDAKNVLRYAGTIDNDLAMAEPDEKRIPYFERALAALADGQLPEIWMTRPEG